MHIDSAQTTSPAFMAEATHIDVRAGPSMVEKSRGTQPPKMEPLKLPANTLIMTEAIPKDSKPWQYISNRVQLSIPGAKVTKVIRNGNRNRWENFNSEFDRLKREPEEPYTNRSILAFGLSNDRASILDLGDGDHLGPYHQPYGPGLYFADDAIYPVTISPIKPTGADHNKQIEIFSLTLSEVLVGQYYDYGALVDTNSTMPPMRGDTRFDSVTGTESEIGARYGDTNFGRQYVVTRESQAYPHFTIEIEVPMRSDPVLRSGMSVALYNKATGQFLRMEPADGGGLRVVGRKVASERELRSYWASERFKLVVTDKGTALYSDVHKSFVRIYQGKVDTPGQGHTQLHPSWAAEYFNIGNGHILFNPSASTYLTFDKDGPVPRADKTNACFTILHHPEKYPAELLMSAGSTVSLCNSAADGRVRALKMGEDGTVSGGNAKNQADLSFAPEEMFEVFKARGNQIALYNPFRGMVLQINADSVVGSKMSSQKPNFASSDHDGARLTVIAADGGRIALHNMGLNRFIRIDEDGAVHVSDEANTDTLPCAEIQWTVVPHLDAT